MGDPGEVRDRATGGSPAARWLWLIWAFWLPYLVPPTAALLSSHPSPPRLILTLIAAVIFVAVYLWTAWRYVVSRTSPTPWAAAMSVPRWIPLVVLVALSLALSLGYSLGWNASATELMQ